MNKEKFPNRDQIQEKFITYLDELEDKELVKVVQKIAPELIQNLTLAVS